MWTCTWVCICDVRYVYLCIFNVHVIHVIVYTCCAQYRASLSVLLTCFYQINKIL